MGKVWGTPHPTGYPLLVVLSHYFVEWFPIGSVPWRANLLSAIFSAAAAVVVWRVLRLLMVSEPVAAASALALGCTPTLWSQSVVAEVYTLNLLFAVAVLYWFLRWHLTGSESAFRWGTGLYALSFGHHLTAITLLPALVFISWQTDRRAFWNPRKVSWAALVIAIGALQYGYLYWRSVDPATVYLESSVRNAHDLWQTVSGAGNRSHMFPFSPGQFVVERIPLFLSHLWSEFGVLLILAAAGLAFLRRRHTVLWFLVLFALGPLTFALNYDIGDIPVYFIPVYMIVAVFLGLGSQWLCERFPRFPPLAMMAIPLVLGSWQFADADCSQDRSVALRVEGRLEIAGRDAVVVAASRPQARFYQVYLLGEGWQQKRRLFVASDVRAAIEYAANQAPLEPPSQSITVPAGLAVFSEARPRGHFWKRRGLRYVVIDGGNQTLYRWLRAGEDEARVAADLIARFLSPGSAYDASAHAIHLALPPSGGEVTYSQ